MTMEHISKEAQDLYHHLLSIPTAVPLIDSLAEQLGSVRRSSREDLRNRFAGEIFELFAYEQLKSELTEGEFLLSAEDTAQVMSRLSGPRQITKKYGLVSGAGIQLIDGMRMRLVNGDYTKITNFYEYKLAADVTARKIPQIIHYGSLRAAQRSLDLFDLRGRYKLGETIQDVRPDIPDNPVVLDPRYNLTFFVLGNSSFSAEGVAAFIADLGRRKHTRTSVNVAEIRRRFKVQKADFDSHTFGEFFRFLICELDQVNRAS